MSHAVSPIDIMVTGAKRPRFRLGQTAAKTSQYGPAMLAAVESDQWSPLLLGARSSTIMRRH